MPKINLKTQAQIELMAEAGHKLAQVRRELVDFAKEGVTTLAIDTLATKLIKHYGAEASFSKVPGYHHSTCINVNDVVVHGIPGKYKLKSGDVVGIDVGLIWKGWQSDTSTTIAIGKTDAATKHFLEVGQACLKKAISEAKVGKRIADISKAMQRVEEYGYSPVQALTGHGIGHNLHEEPAVPCFVVGEYKHSPVIAEGLVLAIEIMYNAGSAEVVYKNDDGWTIATADGKISGLFEETVAVTKTGPVILTI